MHFTCPDGNNKCALDVVLVQLVAASFFAGNPNYPGTDYGVLWCVQLGNGGMVTVPKAAIAAMVGNSMAIVQIMTTVLRSKLPPPNQVDAMGNPVTVVAARGAMGLARY